ncbi:unnamed protein product [Adineta ricciae]|uniref:Intradiol ring-cleavage dioxygenases domain-containing protein n=1 Tax=Adineta ricciae TaxID=249248 RepID=A0A814K4B9_ADIRI|nr:unnamed protein product [Adineta ricciae]
MFILRLSIVLLCVCFYYTSSDNLSSTTARCKRQIGKASGCILTPQAVEGPYYWNSTIRQNITEGKAGIAFRLSIYVTDTSNCTPLVNALVDLWHCDAVGIYSHYIAASQGVQNGANDNQTFFRGLALTDANGIATFDTIYPGWYTGRATHIHLKVHVGMKVTSNTSGTYSDGHVSHTGQLFFNDTLTDSVALVSPYSTHTIVRTRNSEDNIYASSNGSVTLLTVTQNSATSWSGAVTIGVNSTATPSAVSNGGGDAGAGPGTGSRPPNGTNMWTSMRNTSGVIATDTVTTSASVSAPTLVSETQASFYISILNLLYVFLLEI